MKSLQTERQSESPLNSTSLCDDSPVLAIIPARGGSKGIHRKNLCKIGDMPLVAYSIQAALLTPGIDRVVVSTEDTEIAAVAKEFGAEVPFLRPERMAGDKAIINEAVTYTLGELSAQGTDYNHVITLYPTHPFRTINMMQELVNHLKAGFSHVNTVKQVAAVHGFFYCNGDHAAPLLDKGKNTSGKHYLRTVGLFSGRNHSVYGKQHKSFSYLVNSPICNVDIDTDRDLAFAREIVSNNLFDFYS